MMSPFIIQVAIISQKFAQNVHLIDAHAVRFFHGAIRRPSVTPAFIDSGKKLLRCNLLNLDTFLILP